MLYADASDSDDKDVATERADAADNELSALSHRIFATHPTTIHNLQQRAVLAKYWHQHRPDGEKWQAPGDCDAWEDQVIAHLIDGVLHIDTPPNPLLPLKGRCP
jgi:hypothetical protein